jgi:hypothetical protein
MSSNQQAQAALEQAKKLADDANAIKNKSLADAKAIVATAAVTTPPPFKPTFATQVAKSNENKKEEVKQKIENTPAPSESKGKYVYSVFHTIMSIIAIFLSYRCNGCFQWIPFLMALFFPYGYIIYIIIFKSQCLSTSFVEPICAPEVVYIQAPQYGYTPSPPMPSYNYQPSAPMPPTI